MGAFIGMADDVPIGLFIEVAQAPSRDVEMQAASSSFFMGSLRLDAREECPSLPLNTRPAARRMRA
jgi:hypothetical protein